MFVCNVACFICILIHKAESYKQNKAYIFCCRFLPECTTPPLTGRRSDHSGCYSTGIDKLHSTDYGIHRTVRGTSSGYFIMLIVVYPIHPGQLSPTPGVIHKRHVWAYNNDHISSNTFTIMWFCSNDCSRDFIFKINTYCCIHVCS